MSIFHFLKTLGFNQNSSPKGPLGGRLFKRLWKGFFKTILWLFRALEKTPERISLQRGVVFLTPKYPLKTSISAPSEPSFSPPSERSFWSDLGGFLDAFWRLGNGLPEGKISTPLQRNAHFGSLWNPSKKHPKSLQNDPSEGVKKRVRRVLKSRFWGGISVCKKTVPLCSEMRFGVF